MTIFSLKINPNVLSKVSQIYQSISKISNVNSLSMILMILIILILMKIETSKRNLKMIIKPNRKNNKVIKDGY